MRLFHLASLSFAHRIQLGIPIAVADIHPRWRVHTVFPRLNVNWRHIDPETLLTVKDSPVGLPRKCRPRGTRGLPTSAEITNADVSIFGAFSVPAVCAHGQGTDGRVRTTTIGFYLHENAATRHETRVTFQRSWGHIEKSGLHVFEKH
ncbi:hypothetical protein V1522DRAFT_204787 [Lipomyces starkeyi]